MPSSLYGPGRKTGARNPHRLLEHTAHASRVPSREAQVADSERPRDCRQPLAPISDERRALALALMASDDPSRLAMHCYRPMWAPRTRWVVDGPHEGLAQAAAPARPQSFMRACGATSDVYSQVRIGARRICPALELRDLTQHRGCSSVAVQDKGFLRDAEDAMVGSSPSKQSAQ